jgi:hypothetical protein
MKPKFILTILALMALMSTLALPQAFGAITGSTKVSDFDELLGIDKKAAGTKVDVTLTIYFEQKVDSENSCPEDELTDMHFYMRAKIGNDNLTKLGSDDTVVINKSDSFYPFAGVENDVCYLDSNKQQQVIKDFIRETVVPELFAGQTFAEDDVQIKGITNIVQDDNVVFPGCCEDEGEDIYFIVMDLVIAVH